MSSKVNARCVACARLNEALLAIGFQENRPQKPNQYRSSFDSQLKVDKVDKVDKADSIIFSTSKPSPLLVTIVLLPNETFHLFSLLLYPIFVAGSDCGKGCSGLKNLAKKQGQKNHFLPAFCIKCFQFFNFSSPASQSPSPSLAPVEPSLARWFK